MESLAFASDVSNDSRADVALAESFDSRYIAKGNHLQIHQAKHVSDAVSTPHERCFKEVPIMTFSHVDKT